MEHILHHLSCIKPCKEWDVPINWCRVSSMTNMTKATTLMILSTWVMLAIVVTQKFIDEHDQKTTDDHDDWQHLRLTSGVLNTTTLFHTILKYCFVSFLTIWLFYSMVVRTPHFTPQNDRSFLVGKHPMGLLGKPTSLGNPHISSLDVWITTVWMWSFFLWTGLDGGRSQKAGELNAGCESGGQTFDWLLCFGFPED